MVLSTLQIALVCARRNLLHPSHTKSITSSRLKRSVVFGSTIRHKSGLSRYGLGGHHWKRFNPESYQALIQEALSPSNGVSYLEVAGQEGGDIAMVGAIQSALERAPELADSSLTVTTRIGYRTLEPGDPAQQVIPSPGDVMISAEGESATNKVMHNVSSQYVLDFIQASPLLELQQDLKKLNLVFLIHNPEVQVLELLKEDASVTLEERQAYIKNRWSPTCVSLQEYCASQSGQGMNVSFGVVSNGLGIPAEEKHPMHLDPNTIIEAAQTHDRFSTVQLPANLLETQGWGIARKLHSAAPNLSLVAMRPLTCYPDLGTGTGFPFRLVDYSLPSLDGENPYVPQDGGNSNPMAPTIKSFMYTNMMMGVPSIYQIALQTTMSHFDAENLLEIKQERDLNMEERETLEGCKLVQSMIHDLDAELETVRSFAAHEDELYGRIIPLLYGTFEAIDDRTSDVLQAYFAAYAVAVRYSIARNTRAVLTDGEGNSGEGATYPDIPQAMALQEYALRHMLADTCFDRLIIGASTIQDFRHQTDLMESISSDPSPLDAINKANEEETRKEKE